ncbi:uncharacterized protein HD556DRAFT_1442718 [Suillus plorans]|uniref:CxC2-like cysteine cluster KDZ transposase-associated domain-containing protein n=1 Tax=Suillus plorans TaxID=116603 RepID=A0A9P7AQT0_9AGAM|nr:uncharacterized protein HD556DRAFT_1442718 [Suillus plorans]KAG1794530.1 hypothetical protein HD556DRAFT_1442718 [Suillus plorans]
MTLLSSSMDLRSKNSTRFKELLAEAQLEAGHDYLETMDFGDEIDDGRDEFAEDKPVGGPLLSKFFKTCSQEWEPRVRRRIDVRTQTQCRQHANAVWKEQMPILVNGYLAWRHRVPTIDDNTIVSNIFHVDAVGISGFARAITIQQRPNEPANAALLRIGLLGCSPLQLTIAIRIECLELYHQIQRCQSSFGIQAITKVLCTLHNITYFRQLCDQFSDAFDIYLQILQEIRGRIDWILGKDPNTWQINGTCPSCTFKQPNESILSPAWLYAMDGNFSAKRLESSGSADPRLSQSRYFISEAKVDQFKDDVQRRTTSTVDSTISSACTENWTAAKAVDDNKITVFDQTGIFLLACRHGLIECVAEMKCGGELAKYGLATVNRLLDVVVNAFHSFSHDRRCQLQNHPLYLNGLGLEDLETCECIFASSNSAAVLIRHASYFHWMQFLDLHFDQWDMDRYFDLGTFLYNNYVQALQIIETNTPILEEFKQLHNLTDADFISWCNEEHDYLSEVATEPTSDAIAVAYVEQLEKLQYAEATYGHLTSVPFLMYTPANFTRTSGLNATARNNSRAFESEHASVLHKYELQLNVVEDFEHRHSIMEWWLPHDPKYVQAVRYSQERQFICSVEELEGLVVWRLFELSKANLAGTGYKMRKLAPLQNLPRPVLNYSKIVRYASLGEFSVLKHSHHNILTKPLTVSANRKMAAKDFKLVQSHEEIVQLNVEIKHLQSWVEHEDRTMLEAIDSLLADDPDSSLIAELKTLYAKHHRINNNHRKYTGECLPTDHTVIAPNGDRDDEGSMNGPEDDAMNEEAMRLEDLMLHSL